MIRALVLALAVLCAMASFAFGLEFAMVVERTEGTSALAELDECIDEVFFDGVTPKSALPQCSLASLLGSYLRSNGSDHRLLTRIGSSPSDAVAFWEINERLLSNGAMNKEWFRSHSASPVEIALKLMFANLGEADTLHSFAVLAANADGWYAEYVADMIFELFCQHPAFFADHLDLFEKHIPWIHIRMHSLPQKERFALKKTYSGLTTPAAKNILQWFDKE